MFCKDYKFKDGKRICHIHTRHEGTPFELTSDRVKVYCMSDNSSCPEKSFYPEELRNVPGYRDTRPGTLGYAMDQAGL